MGLSSRVIFIFACVLVYIVLAFVIALRGYKETKNVEDYFLAGRGVGVVLLAFTMYATYQSAYMYIGATGFTYTHGVGIWYSNIANLLWAFLFLLIAIPMWKLSRVFKYVSQGDFFAHRYQSNILRYAVAFWMILGLTPYIGSQVMSVGITFETLTEGAIPFAVGAIIYIGAVGVYATIGGMKGVIWTDLMGGIFMLLAIWAGVVFLLPQVGGLTGLFHDVAEKAPELLSLPGPNGLLTPLGWFGFLLCDALGGIMWIQNWLRFYMGKSWRTLAAMACLVPIGTSLTFAAATIYGLSGRVLIPELVRGDQVMPSLILHNLPLWIGAIITVGLFAASMTTVDSLSIALSTSLTRDVVQRINPDMPDKKMQGIGRMGVLCFLIVGALVGYYARGTYLVVLLTLLSLSLSALLFPIAVAGLYWKRATKEGALAGLVVGVIVGVKLLLIGPEFDPYFGMYGGVWAILATTITLILVSLFTQPTKKEIIDEISMAIAGKPLHQNK